MDFLLWAEMTAEEMQRAGAFWSGVAALVGVLGKIAYDVLKARSADNARDDDRADKVNRETNRELRKDNERLIARLDAKEAELLACRESAASLRIERDYLKRKLERLGDKSE